MVVLVTNNSSKRKTRPISIYQLVIKFKALYKESYSSKDYPSDKSILSAIRRWMRR